MEVVLGQVSYSAIRRACGWVVACWVFSNDIELAESVGDRMSFFSTDVQPRVSGLPLHLWCLMDSRFFVSYVHLYSTNEWSRLERSTAA